MYPLAICVELTKLIVPCEILKLSRLTVPLRTLEMKTCGAVGLSLTAKSQGPLMFVASVRLRTCVPDLSRIISEPACTVALEPSVVGILPTTTNPLLSTPSAVVRPRPLGPWKKTERAPAGVMLSMVVPVPWRLADALKFETRMSPAASGPPAAKPLGTKATP